MGLPVIYRKQSENSIASYDFIDAFENLGYIDFYGISLSGATTLSRKAIASEQPTSPNFSADQTAFKVYSDKSWDLSFNVPAIIANAPIYTSMVAEMAGDNNGTAHGRLDFVVYKVNAAGTATQIVRVSGQDVYWGGNKSGSNRMVTKATMPKTKFKRGEKLRVQTIYLAYIQSGTPGTTYLWFDGASRGNSVYNQINPQSSSADLGYKNTTDLKVTIPFNLDI